MNRDDLDKWTEQWEKAQDMDIFDNPKPVVPERFIDKDDAEYWRRACNLPEIINEDYEPSEKKELVSTAKYDGKTVGKITDELGGLPNPVSAPYRGQDTLNKVTPSWAGGEDILELHNMRVQLQQLEDKLAADPMMEDKKSRGVEQQIKNLWTKLDELSSSLNPDYKKDYLS